MPKRSTDTDMPWFVVFMVASVMLMMLPFIMATESLEDWKRDKADEGWWLSLFIGLGAAAMLLFVIVIAYLAH